MYKMSGIRVFYVNIEFRVLPQMCALHGSEIQYKVKCFYACLQQLGFLNLCVAMCIKE